MITQPPPLIEVFAEIPDFRHCRGNAIPCPPFSPWPVCAMLCGYRTYSGHRRMGAEIMARGWLRPWALSTIPPVAATLHTVSGLWTVTCGKAARCLGGTGRCESPPGSNGAAVALDGKTLRGSRKQGAPGVHLLSALSHHVGLTLAQQAVSDKTNEITQSRRCSASSSCQAGCSPWMPS